MPTGAAIDAEVGKNMTRTHAKGMAVAVIDRGKGVIVFDGPEGHGFYKGGHDGQTANTMVCVEESQRCVVILSNDVAPRLVSRTLVRFILGDTGVPYDWEYGDRAGKS